MFDTKKLDLYFECKKVVDDKLIEMRKIEEDLRKSWITSEEGLKRLGKTYISSEGKSLTILPDIELRTESTSIVEKILGYEFTRNFKKEETISVSREFMEIMRPIVEGDYQDQTVRVFLMNRLTKETINELLPKLTGSALKDTITLINCGIEKVEANIIASYIHKACNFTKLGEILNGIGYAYDTPEFYEVFLKLRHAFTVTERVRFISE